ncbi:DUF1353 domain-containing protein [Streptomyces viridochromogenes]|uniref:DUF1353 domain-containing protein n=1 Tax=Streptomyces viridochromogenes Tue57 TaxID=1160705 RepID=L8PMJ9_STRVR|nr:DUF1353 domain-containing protein [Streptomyces viridochromogenes]ELS58831.1 hypothetical protein STVIR_0219 [Streptomyces viridochromogenes Tue57]
MAASEGSGPITQQPRRFYDGGIDASAGHQEVPPDPDSDARIELQRVIVGGREYFMMQRRIAYRDRHVGELLVPRETGTFRTDLTSVPTFLTWLVPKTGEHLPATLLHDGLSHPEGAPEYISTDGKVVWRAEADRVLRDALADAGTALIRRWLIWSAVAMATMLHCEGTNWPTWLKWRYRLTVGMTGLGILVLGAWATLDLLDVEISWLGNLWWMGNRPWWEELVGGLTAAIVFSVGWSVTWGRFWKAGAVVGVSLAVLLHVTAALLFITALYQVTERFTRKAPKAARTLAGFGMLAALAGFVAVLSTR